MGNVSSRLQLSSPEFESLGKMPRKFTQEGDNISPPLEWTNVPSETRSFAIICHDPDAGVVVMGGYGVPHWVLYNIPADVLYLPEGTDKYTQGINIRKQQGYIGPMPPEGHGQHHYYFWTMALNKELDLKSGLTLWELMHEIEPYVIAMDRLVGLYER